ncbi:hypothetical protein A5819_001746 [Enterococcus sp. 7E2_DIV0204]|uniref:hypothetical protein n=1 Tax=unclassified Enterococcus TaxID=2608891 RepID=UPI000A32CD91|nr:MULTISPECIES: hypothetical protein [unclassified Enterococcus]OTN89254.1 hypothetical protein A5819_001746 [Enterococcus sp. 7E2_DIV0204]OTP51699.1 hypothetical protein A5884_000894 [Enterococcus sp. 7D2_DIV0200]
MAKNLNKFFKRESVNFLYYIIILAGLLISKKTGLFYLGVVLVGLAIVTNYKMFVKKNKY